MDTADSNKVQNALRSQGQRLHQFEEMLSTIQQELSGMAERQLGFQKAVGDRVSLLTTQFQAIQSASTSYASQGSMGPASTPGPTVVAGSAASSVQPPASYSDLPHLSRPERFSGESGDCRAFLTQCGLHYELQSVHYPTDRAKIAYLISHLTGRAEAWATAEWNRDSHLCNSFADFTQAFTQIFQHVTPGREAARVLVNLRQGRRRVADYAIEFRTVAAESGWNQTALLDAFLCGLSSALKDHLAALDLPEDLDALIALAIKIDKRLMEREREKGAFKSSSRDFPGGGFSGKTGSPSPPPRPVASLPQPAGREEPMQLGRARLTPEERQRRLREGACIYCGQLGHFIGRCPVKGEAHQGGRGSW